MEGSWLVQPRVPVELCRCGGSPQQSPRRLWTWDVSVVEAQGSVLCPLVSMPSPVPLVQKWHVVLPRNKYLSL